MALPLRTIDRRVVLPILYEQQQNDLCVVVNFIESKKKLNIENSIWNIIRIKKIEEF